MRLHRFYTTEKLTPSLIYTNQEHLHQWRNVFRYGVGDKVILFGDNFEYTYTIIEIDKKSVHLHEISKEKSLQRSHHLTLAIALIKKDNFELILEKCTEIGVTCFIPLITSRSLQKIYSQERLQKILIEATEQSGWGSVPLLEKPMTLSELFNKNKSITLFSGEGSQYNKSEESLGGEIMVIGPEGGFTDEELILAKKVGVKIVSLGENTLRAETAAISITSLVLLQ